MLGYMQLKLWMETRDYNDMDVFVVVNKIGTDGKLKRCDIVRPEQKVLRYLYKNIPVNALHYSGPNARLRASLRHIDEAQTTDKEIFHTFDRVEKLKTGECVPLQFNLGPVGMIFHKGEKIRLMVAGFDLAGGALPSIKPVQADNKGKHIIRTGRDYESYLQVHMIL